MDSEAIPPPRVDLVKCCNCDCSCSLINGSYSGTWLRSVKRKFDEFEDGGRFVLPGFDYLSVARVEVENECTALREMVASQQQSIQDLYMELEEERNAASSAANEAMSMILRLQREKAEVQMEARQFKRFAEEKMAHDQEEIFALEDLLYKREQAIQALTCEVQAYKHRMMSYGLTEAEAEGEGEKGGHARSQSMFETFDAQFQFPAYDYPPLKCNLNEPLVHSEHDNETADVEKYAFGETPRDREHLKNLEYRICQLEGTPRSNEHDGDLGGTKNILEKVIVNQSPRRARHLRRFSTESSNSLLGSAREMGQDFTAESPRPGSSFNKTEYISHMEDYSNVKKFDDASENGDDMSDRVYTIDSVHNGVSYNGVTETKASVGMGEDYVTTPRGSLKRADVGDPDIKKLYMRLQALEADRESMKQALISMRTDKAQLVLLKEIAQQLCKEATPQRRMPIKKASVLRSFSLVEVLKWVLSFIFWRKRARRSKHTFGLSANNVGLLMLLDKGPRMRNWRCLTSAQV
ncbi:myosin-binding protein 7 [Malania oleifera]|uniref:myosin-binding protein 7 n=1 Tax=Malania oleifera TaxID=397392 RepID=UPI0025AE41C1|nr:myosin-binding protein 7 [Malania oleifera]